MTAASHKSTASKFSPGAELLNDVLSSANLARHYLYSIQKPDGHWCGALEGDTILESEYVLTMFFLGLADVERVKKVGNRIRQMLLPDGGCSIYPGGPPEVSASVKAYFALKLLGDDPNSAHMEKTRSVIRSLGGLDAVNSFTRLYLALFGQFPWEKCPAVPPEVILFPTWFPLNIYEMSAWSRAIVIPLSIIWALKPQCEVPLSAAISELWTTTTVHKEAKGAWKKFFAVVDSVLKYAEKKQWRPWRQRALKQCEQWMIEHFRKSDGIGAIFPPIINSIIALRALGYSVDSNLLSSQLTELEKLKEEKETIARLSPCYSPVWDSVLAICALAESGVSGDDLAFQKAARWVVDKEVREPGDWTTKNPDGEPGGWYFEYANEFYPDVDDSFQVLTALCKVRFSDPVMENQKNNAINRAVRWILSMQNKDGGWGSFDRGCDKYFLTQVPFADHNAMIDPSTSDITGRGLEAFAALGFGSHQKPIRKAIQFLHKEQEPDGSWFGRWGCNYIYGTWLALRGLKAIGADMRQPRYQKAAQWLRSIQNKDGGWGELPLSYEDPTTKGKGPSTPSQTAWALMGLMAANDFESNSVLRGIEYLLEQQRDNGAWVDNYWTGTGFPEVFYLRYHLYAVYFPLLALGRFKQYLAEFGADNIPAVRADSKGASQIAAM